MLVDSRLLRDHRRALSQVNIDFNFQCEQCERRVRHVRRRPARCPRLQDSRLDDKMMRPTRTAVVPRSPDALSTHNTTLYSPRRNPYALWKSRSPNSSSARRASAAWRSSRSSRSRELTTDVRNPAKDFAFGRNRFGPSPRGRKRSSSTGGGGARRGGDARRGGGGARRGGGERRRMPYASSARRSRSREPSRRSRLRSPRLRSRSPRLWLRSRSPRLRSPRLRSPRLRSRSPRLRSRLRSLWSPRLRLRSRLRERLRLRSRLRELRLSSRRSRPKSSPARARSMELLPRRVVFKMMSMERQGPA